MVKFEKQETTDGIEIYINRAHVSAVYNIASVHCRLVLGDGYEVSLKMRAEQALSKLSFL